MSQAEALQWSAYMARRGSLNLGRRIEIGFAQVLDMMARYMGNKDVSLKDFMPHEHLEEREEFEPVASFGEFMAVLQASARK